MSKRKYIFVHGLSGWGSYDSRYQKFPYWGMGGGDMMEQLRREGYDCYAASVHPSKSAYDRACELYAQLTGTVTDYGANHAREHEHDQFGPDFTGRPLIDKLDDETELVLIGHSFGGATIRMFAHMMAYGNPEEPDSDSPLFKGGSAHNIFAVITIAAPHNGTTAYDLYEDPSFDIKTVRIPLMETLANRFLCGNTSKVPNVSVDDLAGYDMHIDNAMKLNVRIKTLPDTYYFSQPCCATYLKDGKNEPMKNFMEIMYRRSSRLMCAYKGKTKEGITIGEAWQPNDGLVNTVSAEYPLLNPHKQLDEANIEKGIWQVMATVKGDHMSLQGGLFRRYNILPYYRKLLEMVEKL